MQERHSGGRRSALTSSCRTKLPYAAHPAAGSSACLRTVLDSVLALVGWVPVPREEGRTFTRICARTFSRTDRPVDGDGVPDGLGQVPRDIRERLVAEDLHRFTCPSLHHELVAVLGEPAAALFPVWHGPLDGPPEVGRVVWLAQVDEFVDHDVIDDARREQDALP